MFLGLAATGAAIAGAIIFFTSTKKGKKTVNKWNMEGKKIKAEIKEIVDEAKRKIKAMKEDIARDWSTEAGK